MKRSALIFMIAVATSSCTPPPPAQPPRTAVPAPAHVTPSRSQTPQQQTPRPRPSRGEPRDMCGARDLQYLVGKPRTAIPVPVDVSRRRVACTTCPVTQDYREDRLNIFFDAGTGIIKEVKCG